MVNSVLRKPPYFIINLYYLLVKYSKMRLININYKNYINCKNYINYNYINYNYINYNYINYNNIIIKLLYIPIDYYNIILNIFIL